MTRPRLATLVAVAIGIGVIDAIAFVVFETAVDHGSDEVWNTLARTDEIRWLVVPLAIVLSIAFSLVVRLVGQPRYSEPKTDLLADGGTPKPASVTSIAVIFFVGVSSLVAGASLGPEASLMALSVAVGTWLAARSQAPATTHKRSCSPAQRVTKLLDARLPWAASAAGFGAALGVIYLAGGQTIEFSGKDGTELLLERSASYSALALGGLALAKALATAWSLTTGYRGGVVFPSIFTAVATGLFVAHVASSFAGPGVVVGVVAGILTAMTGAAFAIVFVLSLLPVKLVGLVAVGTGGAVLCDRVITTVATRPT